MTTKYHQISLKESFSNCQNQFIDDTPSLFTTASPNEDKSVGDASALVPVLSDFFTLHPAFHFQKL